VSWSDNSVTSAVKPRTRITEQTALFDSAKADREYRKLIQKSPKTTESKMVSPSPCKYSPIPQTAVQHPMKKYFLQSPAPKVYKTLREEGTLSNKKPAAVNV